jgi:hypothetical protein
VNGPGLFRVSTRSAACTAATKVLKEPAEIAVSTIFAKNSPPLQLNKNALEMMMMRRYKYFDKMNRIKNFVS